MKYTLHQYLDMHLGTSPSDEDIARVKKEYWALYRSEHRRQRLQEAKALYLTIEEELWNKLLSEAKKADIDVYLLIKQKLQTQEQSRVDFAIKKLLYECLDLMDQKHPAYTLLESLIAEQWS